MRLREISNPHDKFNYRLLQRSDWGRSAAFKYSDEEKI
jgi:hypothetical protein